MPRPHTRIARIGALALATLLAATTAATASAAPHRSDRAKLQHALDAVVSSGAPGAIALVRDGRRSLRLVSGYENLATRRPMRPRDRFRVGSVTKTFVATVVLQLAGEGRLALEDTVERWLPGLVPGGANITIRQLLNHTSGLGDYADDTFVRGLFDQRARIWTRGELIAIGTSHAPAFAPGTGLAYSSTGYIALGLIVEAASGQPLSTELRRRIFVPLHLHATSLDAKPRIAGRHAHGYTRYHGGRRPLDISVIGQSFAWAAGAIVSNTDDLARFYRALLRGRLLRADLLTAMRTTVPAAGQGWGLGLIENPYHRCRASWGHGGETLGYETNADSSADATRQAVVAITPTRASSARGAHRWRSRGSKSLPTAADVKPRSRISALASPHHSPPMEQRRGSVLARLAVENMDRAAAPTLHKDAPRTEAVDWFYSLSHNSHLTHRQIPDVRVGTPSIRTLGPVRVGRVDGACAEAEDDRVDTVDRRML